MDPAPRPLQGRIPFALLLSLGYALFLVWAASHHVIWRDEARALSIAISPTSLRGLIYSLKDEGHPALWYLILRAAYGLVPTTAVLKAVTVLSAVAGLCVFALFAPYKRWEVLLWTLGLLPIYEYSVLCRSYCLLMPLLFGLCALHPARRRHPWVTGLLLGLLANVAAYGCVLAAAFLAGDGLTQAVDPTVGGYRSRAPFLIETCLTVGGIAAAVIVMLPDRHSLIKPPYLSSTVSLAGQLGLALRSEGGFASAFFSLPWGVPVGLVTVLWYCFLGRRLHLSLFVFVTVLGGELISRLVYPAGLYHQGVVLLALVAAHWMATDEAASDGRTCAHSLLQRGGAHAARTVLLLLLIIQARRGLAAAYADAHVPASSSRNLANYIAAHPDLRGAVLMAEPDFLAEAWPYYLDNPVFIPREGRFGVWTSFTDSSSPRFTLGELLEAAREVHARERAPVLIALGFDLSRPGIFRFSYGKAFGFDSRQRADWGRGTLALKSFVGASTDENYKLYELKP